MFSVPQVRQRRSHRSLLASTLVAAAIGAAVLSPAPASAGGAEPTYTYFAPITCGEWDGENHQCYLYGEMYQTNGTERLLGNRGAYHTLGVTYSPNNVVEKSPTEVYAYSSVWDRSGAGWQRMRMQQSLKVLDTFGATLSVDWGLGGVETTDPTTVSENTLHLSMTREAPLENNHIWRSSNVTFAPHWRQFSVEHVSTNTIEYAASNRDYRLLTQLRMI